MSISLYLCVGKKEKRKREEKPANLPWCVISITDRHCHEWIFCCNVSHAKARERCKAAIATGWLTPSEAVLQTGGDDLQFKVSGSLCLCFPLLVHNLSSMIILLCKDWAKSFRERQTILCRSSQTWPTLGAGPGRIFYLTSLQKVEDWESKCLVVGFF